MKYDQICEECLKEMFRRVGREYPDKEFTADPEWYKKETWTKAEEEDFRQWMRKFFKKHKVSRLDYEVEMFLLMWSWDWSD